MDGECPERHLIVRSSTKEPAMDPLDDVFAAMRVQTALYARLELTAPWGIRFAPGTTARFGLVVRGNCWLTVEGEDDAIPLAAGDCYVLVHGSRYELRDELASSTQDCFDLIGSRVGGIVKTGGGGAAACVITGWFTFDEVGARPLMKLMPTLLYAGMDRDRTVALQSTLELLALETAQSGLGSNIAISRLADVLFINAIRAHAASNGSGDGWLGALADRRLGPALQAIHRDTARTWTVDSLAALAEMSRSGFALRFKQRVGESPFEYITRWRMFRAGALLRERHRPLLEIAAEIGYESEASFCKAFKRFTGLTPGGYRRADGATERRAG